MKRVILIFALVILLPLKTFAVEDKAALLMEEINMERITDSLPEAVKDDLEDINMEKPGIGAIKHLDLKLLINKMLSYFVYGFDNIKALILFGCCLFIVKLLISVFQFDDEFNKLLSLTLLSVTLVFLLNKNINLMNASCGAIRDNIRFLYSFVPLFCSLTAASGSLSSAGAFGGIMLLLCETAGQVIDRIFIPFVLSFLLLSSSAVFSDSVVLKSICRAVKSALKMLLIFTAAVISFVLAFTNHMTNSVDAVSIKAAGLISGTFIPVIGSVLKDAAGSFRGCMYIIKASVGSFGIIAGALIFLPSAAALAVFDFILSFMAAFASSFEDTCLAQIISSFKDCCDMILASQLFVLFITVIAVGTLIFSGYGG